MPGAIGAAEFDLKIPLDSLPRVLEIDGDTIPPCRMELPALERRTGTADSVSLARPRPRIGVARGDGSTPTGAAQALADGLLEFCRRNAESADFHDLGVSRGPGASPPGPPLRDTLADPTDLTKLARAVRQCDLIIGVDSAAVHLSAVLGTPAWVVLEPVSGWYWPALGSRSDWYPGVRIFAPQWPGESSQLVDALDTAFRDWLSASR